MNLFSKSNKLTMKSIIQEVKFIKEFETQFGKLYSFKIVYDNEVAFYNSKSKDQKYFTEGKEAEFEETIKTYTDKQGNLQEYKVIKPISQKRQSSFGKALTKEQSRYSGFAMSYSKDLVVAGKVELRDIIVYARMMFDEMVAMDKSLES